MSRINELREKNMPTSKEIDAQLLDEVAAGDEVVIRDLIEAGANLEAQIDHGWTPALLAAANGWTQGLRILIQAGADLEARDVEGRTAAMLACRYGGEACLRELIAAGVDLDARNNEGRLLPCMLLEVDTSVAFER